MRRWSSRMQSTLRSWLRAFVTCTPQVPHMQSLARMDYSFSKCVFILFYIYDQKFVHTHHSHIKPFGKLHIYFTKLHLLRLSYIIAFMHCEWFTREWDQNHCRHRSDIQLLHLRDTPGFQRRELLRYIMYLLALYMPYSNDLQLMAHWRMCLDQVSVMWPTKLKINDLCTWPTPTPFGALKPFKLLLAAYHALQWQSAGTCKKQGCHVMSRATSHYWMIATTKSDWPGAVNGLTWQLMTGPPQYLVMSAHFGWESMGKCGCHIQLVEHTTQSMLPHQIQGSIGTVCMHVSTVLIQVYNCMTMVTFLLLPWTIISKESWKRAFPRTFVFSWTPQSYTYPNQEILFYEFHRSSKKFGCSISPN